MTEALIELDGASQLAQILPLLQPNKLPQCLVNQIFLGSGLAHRKCLIQQGIIYYDISSHGYLSMCV